MGLIKINEELILDSDRIVCMAKNSDSGEDRVTMQVEGSNDDYYFRGEDAIRLWTWAEHWASFDLTKQKWIDENQEPFIENKVL